MEDLSRKAYLCIKCARTKKVRVDKWPMATKHTRKCDSCGQLRQVVRVNLRVCELKEGVAHG